MAMKIYDLCPLYHIHCDYFPFYKVFLPLAHSVGLPPVAGSESQLVFSFILQKLTLADRVKIRPRQSSYELLGELNDKNDINYKKSSSIAEQAIQMKRAVPI